MKRSLFFKSLILIGLAGISGSLLSAAETRTKIAVFDLKVTGDSRELGIQVAGLLRLFLAGTGEYFVVESGEIDQTIRVQRLKPPDIDQNAALRLGKVLKAKYVVIGSINTGPDMPYTLKITFLTAKTGAAFFSRTLTSETRSGLHGLCSQIASERPHDAGTLAEIKMADRKEYEARTYSLLRPDTARWGAEFAGSLWEMDGKDLAKAAPADRRSGETVKIAQYRYGGSAVFFIEGRSQFRFGLSAGYGAMPSVSYNSSRKYANYSSPYYSYSYWRTKLSNETRYVPLDVYLKYESQGGGFIFSAGGGADYLMARTTYDYYSSNTSDNPAFTPSQYSKKGEFTRNKVVPHAQAGFELFLSEGLSINVGAKYLFSAALDNLTGKFNTDGVVDPTKYRMVVGEATPPDGEYYIGFHPETKPLCPNERPFKYDYSGLRANIAIRFYF
ncbi:MAG: hypothetical protein Q7R35_05230 [Elusimicrobiota bacterium]|nr:hypothetical protein [Elusimicrobiota bacterium]